MTRLRDRLVPVARLTTRAEPEIVAWFAGLTRQQRIELGAIEAAFETARDEHDDAGKWLTEGISMDWIEEHGGRRVWWGSVCVTYEHVAEMVDD